MPEFFGEKYMSTRAWLIKYCDEGGQEAPPPDASGGFQQAAEKINKKLKFRHNF